MANEQTSVPLFVADTILTAAQQNISAGTGVPVFATTVTRDAAFGGANKALAEGQLCYLSATNVVQYYDGAAWATVGPSTGAGLVCVKAETAFTAVASLTADNIFTSTYTNYRILVRFTTSADDPFFQLTAATTPTTANYNWQRLLARSTTLTGAAASGASSAMFAASSAGDFFCSASLELFAPQLTAPTTFSSVGLRSDGAYTSPATVQTAGSQSGSIAFDGIKLLVATGTMTGIYSVYGYSKTV